jgi:hypothetical protein
LVLAPISELPVAAPGVIAVLAPMLLGRLAPVGPLMPGDPAVPPTPAPAAAGPGPEVGPPALPADRAAPAVVKARLASSTAHNIFLVNMSILASIAAAAQRMQVCSNADAGPRAVSGSIGTAK